MKLTVPIGHSDPEDNRGHGSLALPLAEGKQQSADNDPDQTEPAGDRPGEADLKTLTAFSQGDCAWADVTARTAVKTKLEQSHRDATKVCKLNRLNLPCVWGGEVDATWVDLWVRGAARCC